MTITLYEIPHGHNSTANTLAKLAKAMSYPEGDLIAVKVYGRQVLPPMDLEYIIKQSLNEVKIVLLIEDEVVDWREPFI